MLWNRRNKVPEMITLPIARKLLKRAMETQGRDFVYANRPETHSKCFYVPLSNENLPAILESVKVYGSPDYLRLSDNDPRTKTGCLIGTALKLHGIAMSKLSTNTQKINQFPKDFPGMIDQDAADYFQEAQYKQDRGLTWGEAYDAAEVWAERPYRWY